MAKKSVQYQFRYYIMYIEISKKKNEALHAVVILSCCFMYLLHDLVLNSLFFCEHFVQVEDLELLYRG